MSDDIKIDRFHLPVPDRPWTGLITYDAKDPDSKFPPIEQLRQWASHSEPGGCYSHRNGAAVDIVT